MQFLCETVNRCIRYTVRWEVRIFAVVQNTPQNRKVDRGIFRCRVCFNSGKTGNRLVFAEKLHFRVINYEYSIENGAILVIYCVYTLTGRSHGK